MRASKRLPLMMFLTALLISLASAQESPASASDSKTDFGIDLDASYPGTTVQALLEAAADEANTAIDEAYAEGYKAGLLDTAPDRDYWKSMAESSRREADKKQAMIFFAGISIGAGATALTTLIMYIAKR